MEAHFFASFKNKVVVVDDKYAGYFEEHARRTSAYNNTVTTWTINIAPWLKYVDVI